LLPARRLDRPELRSLLACEQLAADLAEEEQAYDRVRQEYASIRAAFAHAGIRDVLIKSSGVAPSFPHLSDNVDDLAPAALVPAARLALRSLGYVELRNLEEPHKFFFKRFAEGQEVAAHHLHEHVGWAVSFLDETLLLQRARPAADDADIVVPHPEDAFLITVAHAFYENKAIRLSDLLKVRGCLRSGELEWPRMRALAASKGWLDGLNILLCIFSRLDAAIYGATLFPQAIVQQAGQELSNGHRQYIESLFVQPLVMPLHISFTFSKRLFYAKCLHDRRRSSGGKLYDIVRHTLNGAKLKLDIHSQPGMLVTFSGVDGCGKTRHAQALVNAFQGCGIDVAYVWSRSGSSRLTDAVVRLGKAALRRPSSSAASQEERGHGRRAMLRNPLVRALWTGLVVFDLLWQYMVRVRLPLLIGRVVVCDRYTYDAIADIAAVTGQRSSIFLSLLTLLSPRPSPLTLFLSPVGRGNASPSPSQGEGGGEGGARAAFLLSVQPSTAAVRREGELSEATLDQQRDAYVHPAQEHTLTLIDNSRPFAEVNDAIVTSVLRSYYARYRTLLNALFMANPDRSSR